MPETPNHGYNVPSEGEQDWHEPLNENFEDYDTDIEVRDEEANRSNYDPKAGAKFLATDTGNVYVGDGSSWTHVTSTGSTPTLTELNPDGEFLGVGRSDRLTGSEYFGVQAPTGSGSYGGMYINTEGTEGWPFYGYSTGGDTDAWHYYDGETNKWNLSVNGIDRFTVDDSGQVGVGTDSPETPLDVRGQNNWDLSNSDGDFRIGNDDYRVAIGVALGGGGAGNVRMRAKGGGKLKLGTDEGNALIIEDRSENDVTHQTVYIPDHLALDDRGTKIYTGNANTQSIYFEVAGSSNLLLTEGGTNTVFGDLNVTGEKNFVQTVDTDEGEKEVAYTASEAPTPRTECSGVAELEDGRAEIDLPEHFAWVTSDAEPLIVQVTPYAGERGLKVIERSTKRVVVKDLGGEGSYEFSYTVKGTRDGHAEKQVVREPTAEGASEPVAPADD